MGLFDREKEFKKEVTLKCSMCGKPFKKVITANSAADLASAVALLKKREHRCDDCKPENMGKGGSW